MQMLELVGWRMFAESTWDQRGLLVRWKGWKFRATHTCGFHVVVNTDEPGEILSDIIHHVC